MGKNREDEDDADGGDGDIAMVPGSQVGGGGKKGPWG